MKKKRLHIGIRNSLIAGNTLELYFLDEIFDYIDWSEFTMVNLVEDVINKVNAARPSKIIAYINSEGGSCVIGLAIYNFLRYLNVEVETRTLSLAGSIASVIAQAADTGRRYIARAGHMVIHEAWGYGAGTAQDMRLAADMLDTYTDTVCGVYADRTGKPKEEIRAMIAPGDYWMTGEQAVELGFADGLFDDIPQGFELNNTLRGLDDHYRNVPEDLKPLTQAAATPAPAPLNTVIPPQNDPVMTWKEKLAALMNKIKGTAINRAAPNLGEEIVNAIGEPLQEFLEGLNTEWETRFNAIQAPGAEGAAAAAPSAELITSITNSVRDGLQTEISALTTANATLTTQAATLIQQNEALQQELAEAKGGEVTNHTPAEEIIGYGIKAATPPAAN